MAKQRGRKKTKKPEVRHPYADYSNPGIIGMEACLQLVQSGQKKCYCKDGACGCRRCQEIRAQKNEKPCDIAKEEGACKVIPECKKCPNYEPCF